MANEHIAASLLLLSVYVSYLKDATTRCSLAIGFTPGPILYDQYAAADRGPDIRLCACQQSEFKWAFLPALNVTYPGSGSRTRTACLAERQWLCK